MQKSSYKKKKNIEDNIIMSANTWSLQRTPQVALCHCDLLKKAGVNPNTRKGRFHRSLPHVWVLKTDLNQAAPCFQQIPLTAENDSEWLR